MAGNSFGQIFRVTTCGESHGGAVAVIVDGMPAGFAISHDDIQLELDRRRPGQSFITTSRQEYDTINILSGIFEGKTTGTPILLLAYNKDANPQDYEQLKDVFRPSHADFTYFNKYGIRDYRGGGRSSARETLARVAAGAIAKKYLLEKLNIQIMSYVVQVADISTDISYKDVTYDMIESNPIRCPDSLVAKKMIKLIEDVRNQGDAVGGIITCVIKNVPIGLGEPVFDKLNADLAKAMLSINAVKAFEIGSGFAGCCDFASRNNDQFTSVSNNKIRTVTNNSGGILGGISNGEDIYFNVGFKPVSTISIEQNTVNTNAEIISLKAKGRHDPCVLSRAVPIVDAMASIVIMDHYLRNLITK